MDITVADRSVLNGVKPGAVLCVGEEAFLVLPPFRNGGIIMNIQDAQGTTTLLVEVIYKLPYPER
jgi:hypothetical protein